MKRFSFALHPRIRRVAALTMLAVFVVPQMVTAGQFRQKEIFWQISSVGTPTNPTGIFVRDTVYNVIGNTTTYTPDTTGDFSASDADPIVRGVVAPGITAAGTTAPSDSSVLGWVIFQPDSTAAGTSSLSALTLLIDGRAAGTGSAVVLSGGWTKADSAAAQLPSTTGAEQTVAIPVRTISPYGNVMRFENLRARITAITGIMTGQVRAYFRYWDNDCSPDSR